MGSKTKSVGQKGLKVAFTCEADGCALSFKKQKQLQDHVSASHADLSISCKCGAGFADMSKLTEHKTRCALRYGSSTNKKKQVVIENRRREKMDRMVDG